MIEIMAVFAVYRLARLFSYEEGPFGIFEKIRGIMGAFNYQEDGQPDTNPGRFSICPHCWGLWFSMLPAVFLADGLEIILYWLAIAGGQSFLQEVITQWALRHR